MARAVPVQVRPWAPSVRYHEGFQFLLEPFVFHVQIFAVRVKKKVQFFLRMRPSLPLQPGHPPAPPDAVTDKLSWGSILHCYFKVSAWRQTDGATEEASAEAPCRAQIAFRHASSFLSNESAAKAELLDGKRT